MKELHFEFTTDRSDNTVCIKREFSTSKVNLWKAWTSSSLLDKWWAPQPFKNITKHLELRAGGAWFYSMNGPTGEVFWGKTEYKSVQEYTELVWLDAFCDAEGVLADGMPRSLWSIAFSEYNGIASVSIVIKHEKWEDIEANIKMGFKEGFTMALSNLDELLKTM